MGSIVIVGPNVHNLQFDPSAVLGYADAWVA
jgi:hypothetical protein